MPDTSDFNHSTERVTRALSAHYDARAELLEALSALLAPAGLEISAMVPTETGWTIDLHTGEASEPVLATEEDSHPSVVMALPLPAPAQSHRERRAGVSGEIQDRAKPRSTRRDEPMAPTEEIKDDDAVVPVHTGTASPTPILKPATPSAIHAPAAPAILPLPSLPIPKGAPLVDTASVIPLPPLQVLDTSATESSARPEAVPPAPAGHPVTRPAPAILPDAVPALSADTTIADISNIPADVTAGYDIPSQGHKRENPLRAPESNPKARAQSLARTLVGEIVAYRPAEHQKALADGVVELRKRLGHDIERARTQFMHDADEALGDERGTIFVEAVNTLLGRGLLVLPTP